MDFPNNLIPFICIQLHVQTSGSQHQMRSISNSKFKSLLSLVHSYSLPPPKQPTSNEPTEVSLGFQASLRFVAHQQLKTMDPTTPPPLDFDHKPGFEIPTKYKEAIRQLHSFAGKLIEELMC
jgi:hypothetical protein